MKQIILTINSDRGLEENIKYLRELYRQHRFIQLQVNTNKKRTLQQNKALHVFCSLVAQALNENGFDVRQILSISKRAEIPWTGDAVKEYLWKPIQKAVIGKASTTKASTQDYTQVYDILNKFLGESCAIHVPWPSREGEQ